jgi:potassium/hydrogen antiporter
VEQLGIMNFTLLLGAILVLVGIFSSIIASRFGVSLLLIFLVIGMLAGEDGPGGIHFNNYSLTYLVGSLALAVILFDGGLRTRAAIFRGTIGPASVLATLGVLITAALTGVFAARVLDLSWIEGLLIGSIVGSTDAAAVFFLMRAGGLQLRRKVKATLEIESGTNDPVAVFLTIILVELLLISTEAPLWHTLKFLSQQIAFGIGVGLIGGYMLVISLNRISLPAGLHPLFVMTSSIAIYGLAATLQGSGFLAVYLAGLVLGNRPARAFPSILSFHNAMTWLCQILMFLVLGLLVTPSKLVEYLLPAMLVAVFLTVVARPVAVWLCLWPFNFTFKEKGFIAWVGLRGAVSIFLAAIPTLSGVPNAELYFNVAFVVVLMSLLIQGWTVTKAASVTQVALSSEAAETQHIEIDLPGQQELELVGYPIVEDSPALSRSALPSWIRPVMVAREGVILSWEQAGKLRGGDYGYFLVPTDRAQRLDRFFAQSDAIRRRHPIATFTFGGELSLQELGATYSLAIPEDIGQSTIAEAFASRFEDQLGIGDRIPLGQASLVVTELDQDAVKFVILEVDDFDYSPQIQIRGPAQDELRNWANRVVSTVRAYIKTRWLKS